MDFRRTLEQLTRCLCYVLAVSGCGSSQDTLRIRAELVREVVPKDSAGGLEISEAVVLQDDSTIVAIADNGQTLVRLTWRSPNAYHTGRVGSGPGEYRTLSSLVSDGGGFATVDIGNARLLKWTANGAIVASRDAVLSPIVGAWQTDSGTVLRVGDAFTMQLKFILYPRAQASPRVFRQVPMALLSSELSCTYCPVAVSRHGALALAPSDTSYRIGRYDSRGERVPPIIRVGIPIVSLSPADRDSMRQLTELSLRFLRSQKSITPEELAIATRTASMQLVKPRFLIPGLLFDEEDNLWVQRNVVSGADAEIDVFNPSGALRETVTLPGGYRMIGIRRNRVLVLRAQADGTSALAEYVINPQGTTNGRPLPP